MDEILEEMDVRAREQVNESKHYTIVFDEELWSDFSKEEIRKEDSNRRFK